jgi:peptidoglycan biosynthesis protein MviN/MurJ (putative lipid II flippase)
MLTLVPFISRFSFWTQSIIMVLLFALSCYHRGSRIAIATIITACVGWQILIPTVNWAVYIFKAVAWFGFYLHFFWVACTMVFTGTLWVIDEGIPQFFAGVEKARSEL